MTLPSHYRALSSGIVHRRARVALDRIAKPLPPLTETELRQLEADVNAARAQGERRGRWEMQPGRPVDIMADPKPRRIRAPLD